MQSDCADVAGDRWCRLSLAAGGHQSPASRPLATEAALFFSFAASLGWGDRPFPKKAFFESLSIVFVGLGDWQGVLFFVWVLFSWAWVIGKEFFSLFDLELFNLELSFDSFCVS